MNSEKTSKALNIIELGKSGLKVTELGFGGIPIMRVNIDEAKLIIEHCFELGIRFFDTAHMYGDSEEKLGEALEPFRDQVVIASKVWAKEGKGAELLKDSAHLLMDQAMIIQGSPLPDRTGFARRMAKFMEKGLLG